MRQRDISQTASPTRNGSEATGPRQCPNPFGLVGWRAGSSYPTGDWRGSTVRSSEGAKRGAQSGRTAGGRSSVREVGPDRDVAVLHTVARNQIVPRQATWGLKTDHLSGLSDRVRDERYRHLEHGRGGKKEVRITPFTTIYTACKSSVARGAVLRSGNRGSVIESASSHDWDEGMGTTIPAADESTMSYSEHHFNISSCLRDSNTNDKDFGSAAPFILAKNRVASVGQQFISSNIATSVATGEITEVRHLPVPALFEDVVI